jgi:ribosomal protein L16 Arg81 hydroxylase
MADEQWTTGAERRPEIRYQLTNPNKPVEAPKSWQTFELAPGDVLFVLRGYWHTTENIDESLHLVLQMKIPC